MSVPDQSSIPPWRGQGMQPTVRRQTKSGGLALRGCHDLCTGAMSTLDGMPGPTSRHFISQRLRLHYVDWGNPDAPPLLLVHGDSQWSPNGNYSMSAYIYDLAQLIHQQGLAPVTIVSHSLGGNISLRYSGIYRRALLTALGSGVLGTVERGAMAVAGLTRDACRRASAAEWERLRSS
jgi:hypothetical protein